MIQVTNLLRVFDKRAIAGLHSVSFSLKEGEIFGLLGPNGSGKTTLLNLIMGTIKADSGEIKLHGKLALFSPEQTSSVLNVQKFLTTSIELDIDEEKKIQLARDLADTFEFTFQLRQNLNELSSGQRQKVLLARELINRPTMLLMDEPFAHLDPFTRKDILAALFRYIRSQGTTVLWVTHDLEEALRFSDRLGILNFGKFEQVGTPKEIVKNPRNLFTAQFIGYRNFFPVKLENGQWISAWGELPYQLRAQEHAILVVPDSAWIVAGDGLPVVLEESYACKQRIEYSGYLGDKKIYLQLPSTHSSLKLTEKVLIRPDFGHSFLIPL
jgi:ABC-type Fe3+/spermidine/putrescine transport system ATPase subunit